jgi:hypothetical protein
MNRRIILGGGIAVLLIAIMGVAWLSAAPAIGPIAATPAYVVMNVPTQVVVTAVITDTSVITNGVSLLKIDNSGKTLATLGTMRDDGLNGDGVAGDKVFSLRTTVAEPSVGQIRFQVSAAFRGIVKRVLSEPVVVTVDPLALPPDPGDAGKQTLEGIDTDRDGVRDDVQRFIVLTLGASSSTTLASFDYAKALQVLILSGDDASMKRLGASIACMRYIRGGEATNIVRAIQAQQLNTHVRLTAWEQSANQISGGTFDVPSRSDWKRQCSFDPDAVR